MNKKKIKILFLDSNHASLDILKKMVGDLYDHMFLSDIPFRDYLPEYESFKKSFFNSCHIRHLCNNRVQLINYESDYVNFEMEINRVNYHRPISGLSGMRIMEDIVVYLPEYCGSLNDFEYELIRSINLRSINSNTLVYSYDTFIKWLAKWMTFDLASTIKISNHFISSKKVAVESIYRSNKSSLATISVFDSNDKRLDSFKSKVEMVEQQKNKEVEVTKVVNEYMAKRYLNSLYGANSIKSIEFEVDSPARMFLESEHDYMMNNKLYGPENILQDKFVKFVEKPSNFCHFKTDEIVCDKELYRKLIPALTNASYGLMSSEPDPYCVIGRGAGKLDYFSKLAYLIDEKGENNMIKITNNGFEFKNESILKKDYEIEKVIFNKPATIVLWKDGTKTVVKAQDDDFNPEVGLSMAISKKVLGTNKTGSNYYDEFKKWLPKE